uniref:MAT1 centre domain-containing protein n=1 Tax=Arcella intermedia TaxID=1963864 RepID=A0A6B2LD46_9EUKA|eukprot:TRINITY_DN21020_c0_g1_i1.p1 TRINITY_DN21020_c0_g1~~TRINITY_DN21020_c0_g1_i1.p1  ORF type:complete len:246 (-),score=82.79 TRINITY_DN21020_c0_g1_i1:77-814(-)
MCKTKLKRDKFYHTQHDDSYRHTLQESEREISKVFNHTRDDFDSLVDYNMLLEIKDSLIFSMVNGGDVKKKIKEHKELKAKAGLSKKRKLDENEKLQKQKYIIEEFKRLRKRMSARENLTFDRLRGNITAEACQQEGDKIEKADFQQAQAPRIIKLKQPKAPTLQPLAEYKPQALQGNAEFPTPELVDKEAAEKALKSTKEGAFALLPNWTSLTKIQQSESKKASGWSFLDIAQRAKEEAYGSLL